MTKKKETALAPAPENPALALTRFDVDVTRLQRQAAEIVVTKQEEAESAASFIASVAKIKKDVEAEGRKLAAPFKEQVNRVQAGVRALVDVLDSARNAVQGRVVEWRTKEEEARATAYAKEQAKYEKKVEKAEAKGKEPPPAPLAPPPPDTAIVGARGGVAFKKVWTFEEVDHAAVPAEFTVLDAVKVRARMFEGVRETGAPPEIPGVRFFQKDVTAVQG